jgi:hypothetical protein
VPQALAFLDPHLTDPLHRALAGIGPAPENETTLERRVLSGLAACDAGTPPPARVGAALEAEAGSDPALWIHAARVHVLSDIGRSRQARSRLAGQDLPYVFPGEIHPLMVDVLAGGDQILPALHVDWVKKLTRWTATDLLRVDCERQTMWFWPVLTAMAPGQLVRPLAQVTNGAPMDDGSLGLAAAYCRRVGAPGELLMAQSGSTDKLLLALATVGAQRRSA